MNRQAVTEWVEKVRVMSGDPEGGHSEEDKLYIAVLKAIAEGTCDDPAGCAAEALKASELDYPRWYA